MAMNPPCVLVGRDVALYTFQAYGPDCNAAANGTLIALRGRWKTVTMELELNWADVTASSSIWTTRRLLGLDWRATLENQIQSNGSIFFYDGVMNNALVQIVFQEQTSGAIFKMTGGIARTGYRAERGEFTETLELISAGDVLGNGQPFYYGLTPPALAAAMQGETFDWADPRRLEGIAPDSGIGSLSVPQPGMEDQLVAAGSGRKGGKNS